MSTAKKGKRERKKKKSKSQKIKCDKINADEDPILRARRFGCCLFWMFIKVLLPHVAQIFLSVKRTQE